MARATVRGAGVLKANIWVWASRSHLLRALAGMSRRTGGTAAMAPQASWKRGRAEGGREGGCSLLLLHVKLLPWISRLQKHETKQLPSSG